MTVRTNKRQKKLRRLVISVVSLAVLWPAGAWAAAEFLIVRHPIEKSDAIVVLSGSATYRERAQHAGQLFNAGRAGRVVLTNDNLKSGWSSAAQRNPYYHELAKEELRRAGVPEANIQTMMVPIVGTHDEALKLRDYCERQNVNSILVVTSAYHSRRALWTFQKVFTDSRMRVGIDPAAAGIETPSPRTWWMHRFGWDLVPREYVKLVGYWVRFSNEI
ncbi:MAG TPA: YdcF family protein [Pyrinomonadaceae bacterium]|nr:YdcF family protein [Pyrinomonadaceae bacterium]